MANNTISDEDYNTLLLQMQDHVSNAYHDRLKWFLANCPPEILMQYHLIFGKDK